MNVQKKSSNGITLVTMDSCMMAERKVFVEGEITQESACNFVKKIMLLTAEDRNKGIDVMINSPGGDVRAGLLMYDVIQSSQTPIRMFCIGRAYSMGALLFACGKHGRFMLPNSELMLHEPCLGNSVGGSVSSIQSISESLLETKKKLNRILEKHTGKSEKEIEAVTGFDHYFNAEESIDFGLADGIAEFHMMIGG